MSKSPVTRSDGLVMNRRHFIAISAVTLLGIGSGIGIYRAKAEPIGAQIDLTTLGMGTDKSGVENREAFVKALAHSDRRYFLPSGSYLMDNSHTVPGRGANGDGVINVDGFSGDLEMRGGSRIVFLDSTKRGFVFYRGTGAVFKNVDLTFDTKPEYRVVPEECLKFDLHDDVRVLSPRINGSASAGILFYRSKNPVVRDAIVRDTMADGIHFANCQDAHAYDCTTLRTGDDGLAFVNYADSPAFTGGYANNISVTDSNARGITVVGQSRVVIENFQIKNTNSSGLLVASDASYNTRVPSNVIVRNGTVRHAGYKVDPSGKTGNEFGIELDTFDDAALFDIRVLNSKSRGLSSFGRRSALGRITNGRFTLRNVFVYGANDNGYNIQNSLPDIKNCGAFNTNGPGWYFRRCPNVRYSGSLATNRISNTSSEWRTFRFENDGRINGTNEIL